MTDRQIYTNRQTYTDTQTDTDTHTHTHSYAHTLYIHVSLNRCEKMNERGLNRKCRKVLKGG